MENWQKDIIKNQINQELNIEKSMDNSDLSVLIKSFYENLSGSYDRDLFEKSWSSDLQKRFPNAEWRTINGAKVLLNNGKVVAGLDGFNGEIDKFFESKKGKESDNKKRSNANTSNLKAMLKDGLVDVDKTINAQGKISDQQGNKIKKLLQQAKMADKYPNDKSLQDIKEQYNRAVSNKKEADELLNVAMDFKRQSKSEGKKETSKTDTSVKKETKQLKKQYDKLSETVKESLDEDELKTTETLKNLASKLDFDSLSSDTKDKLNKLQEEVYVNSDLAIEDDKNKLYEAKNIKEFLSAFHSINKRLQKKDEYAVSKKNVDKLQIGLVDALQEQLNRKTTEKLNYKLF